MHPFDLRLSLQLDALIARLEVIRPGQQHATLLRAKYWLEARIFGEVKR